MAPDALSPMHEIFYQSGLSTEQEAELMKWMKQRFAPGAKTRVASIALSAVIQLASMEPSLGAKLEPVRKFLQTYVGMLRKEEEQKNQNQPDRRPPYYDRPPKSKKRR